MFHSARCTCTRWCGPRSDRRCLRPRATSSTRLDITDRYGTDAVRLLLMMSAAPGTDITYSEDRLSSARQFGN